MATTDQASGLTSTATSSSISETISSVASTVLSSATSTSNSAPSATETDVPEGSAGSAQGFQGISLKAFLGALVVALIVFGVQMGIFLLLRNKLTRIFKPKTYLVPERERTESPPTSPLGMLRALMRFDDREIIEKCGLDAYFFLRYLKTLLVIFVPITCVVLPILIPLNYIGGRGQDVVTSGSDRNKTNDAVEEVTGLDTLAWGNISAENTERYWAHLILALCVIGWVCTVFFFELRVYIKVRQDYLTSAEHRLRASATTVLVNSIPSKWLSEEALRGLFDVFPGGIRNVWVNRDMQVLLDKVHERDRVHLQLEAAETELIKAAKRRQLKLQAREEKMKRKQQHTKGPTKEELALKQKEEDARAQRMAHAGHGFSSGQNEEVPQDIADVISEQPSDGSRPGSRALRNPIPMVGTGLAKVGQGIFGGVQLAGRGLKTLGEETGKGLKTFGGGVDDKLETTNGFTAIGGDESYPPPSRGSDRRAQLMNAVRDTPQASLHSRNVSDVSQDASLVKKKQEGDSDNDSEPVPNFGNTVRKVSDIENMYLKERVRFWQFWKPPAGGYASPIPQGAEEDGRFPFPSQKMSKWQQMKMALPFLHADVQPQTTEYPSYFNESLDKVTSRGEPRGELWEKWVKPKNRPTHRLPLFSWGPNFLVGFKKVDTIDWCRKELARLNMEIEEDQKNPERYPLMNSAFIQFNHQVAAHMACQSLMHHVPKQMAPREIEISPKDVIWDNMAVSWWQEWVRSTIVTAIIGAMLVLWAIPVAFTASLGQLDSLVKRFHWLGFLTESPEVEQLAQVVVGVLPAIFLSLLLILVPIILGILAEFKGAKTGSQKTEFVQLYFFMFLFFQVFLIVSITSFFVASVDTLFANLKSLSDINAILDLLADNLPKAANYFFSYMILQALSTSSGTLLQIGALIAWYILARIMDSTARNKWTRNTRLSSIKWGSFFPVYTNFACIALVYSVVAPLISIFAIITFSLLWVAQRYSMLYVTRFEHDTGGVLYPRAINQTFTGLYVMELALAGLFFIVRDAEGNASCSVQGTIMLITIVLTILFQVLLNRSFGPLFRYLPITYEDEACLRDEAFHRAQARRLGLDTDDDDEDEDEEGNGKSGEGLDRFSTQDDDIELRKLENNNGKGAHKFATPLGAMKKVGSWAHRDGGRAVRALTFQTKKERRQSRSAADYRRLMREKDIEKQRAIGDALYGGYHDEIEDLTPDERDALVRYAFQHSAMRARRPTVWVPRDDIGVSDDEIRRTQELTEFIWISNEGTALDSKVRVVYGRAPPDFSEVDLINL